MTHTGEDLPSAERSSLTSVKLSFVGSSRTISSVASISGQILFSISYTRNISALPEISPVASATLLRKLTLTAYGSGIVDCRASIANRIDVNAIVDVLHVNEKAD